MPRAKKGPGAPGRLCSAEGCGTVLSVYNFSQGWWCSIHERVHPPKNVDTLEQQPRKEKP